MPRSSFEIEQQQNGYFFIAKIPILTEPIGAWLNRKEFNAVRTHIAEEGENLKKLLEQEIIC